MINAMLTNCYCYSRWLLSSGPPFLVRFPNPLATPQPPTRSTGGIPFQPAEDASPITYYSVSGSFPVWFHLSFSFGPAESELGVLH